MLSEAKAGERRKFNGHRLTEFIYGTITALVAIAGLSESAVMGWESAASVIVVG